MAGAEAGGAETAFVDMVVALSEAGITQHVVTRQNNIRVPRLLDAGIPVTTLPFGSKIDLYTPWRLRRLINHFKPDIVQTWMSRAAMHVPPCSPKNPHPYLKICRLGGYYKLKYFKGADYFTTITPDIRRYLIDQGISPDRVIHINNFADVDEPQRVLKRADWTTPEDAFLLVTLGRLHRAKAFDTLLRALVHIPDAYLWIGGEGPDAGLLQQLATQLGVTDRVRFLGWVTDRAGLLRAGDVCVFPSRYEPFGTVFVQAWAQKIPLIASRADGPRQYVRDGVDGLMFDIDDVPGLVDCAARLRRDPVLMEHLRTAGYARFTGEFTKERTVRAYIDLYQRLLSIGAEKAA